MSTQTATRQTKSTAFSRAQVEPEGKRASKCFDLRQGQKQAASKDRQRKLLERSQELLIQLNILLRTTTIHAFENEAARTATKKFQAALQDILDAEYEVHIEYTGIDFLVNERWTRLARQYQEVFSWMGEKCRQREIGSFWIAAVPSAEDLAFFVRSFHDVPSHCESPFAFLQGQLWEQYWIALERFEEEELRDVQRIENDLFVRQIYFHALQATQQLYLQASQQMPLKLKLAKRMIQAFVDLCVGKRTQAEALYLRSLTQLKRCLDYRCNSAVNQAILAIAFGAHLGFDRAQLRDLGISALLSDIGMVRIPAEIQEAPELNLDQVQTLQQHPAHAVSVILNTPYLDRSVFQATVAAFSKYLGAEGGGYPKYAEGTQGLAGQILAIVGRYESMTTPRPYRPLAKTPPEALAELMSVTTCDLNTYLVRAFVNWMTPLPPGTVVSLTSGEIAYVLEPPAYGKPADRPVIRVIHPTAVLRQLSDDGFVRYDLSETTLNGSYRWEIANILDGQHPDLRARLLKFLLGHQVLSQSPS